MRFLGRELSNDVSICIQRSPQPSFAAPLDFAVDDSSLEHLFLKLKLNSTQVH